MIKRPRFDEQPMISNMHGFGMRLPRAYNLELSRQVSYHGTELQNITPSVAKHFLELLLHIN